MTAYAFFVNACRLEHHNQFPGQKIKLSEFSTVCAKRWKEMTMDQKRPFAEMADRDKMRYENELKLLFPGEQQPKRRRKKKDPNAPKKNLSPFFIFSKLKRPEIMKDHPSKGVGEISKVLSAEWSSMTEEDKAQYVRLSEEDKVRYQKQLEQYKETGSVSATMVSSVLPGVVGDDDLEEDEEEEEDDFAYPGQTSSASMVMSSSQQSFQQQGQQAGQNMVTTSGVQQGASQGQQFANGQSQMYQSGMMMQQPQQNSMMGQFGSATNNGQVQMMQQPQQQQNHMQGQMHPNFSQANNQQQYMTPSQQQNRMMQQQGGTQTAQQPQQQFMMSSNGPPRGAGQPQMMMQQQQPQQGSAQQMHGSSVEMQQQQMHANQLMQQAAVYQQQINPSSVQIASTQSQSMIQQSNPIDEIKPSIHDMQADQMSTGPKGPSPQPTNDDGSVSSGDMSGHGDMNGQNTNGTASTLENMAQPPVSSMETIKQENSAVQDSNPTSLMTAM